MIEYTDRLDQAAAHLTMGASLVQVYGRYPDNAFTVKTNKWRKWYLKRIGWLPFKKFCQMRKFLKFKCKDKDGIPRSYTPKARGYKFGDIAIVKQSQK